MYAYSKKFDEIFIIENKTLIIQYQIKFSKGVTCGGGFLTILNE